MRFSEKRPFSVMLPRGTVRGSVVVLHGLNMKPECMLELAAVCAEAGMAVVLGSLRGHGEQSPIGAWATVTSEDWLADAAACRNEAIRLAAGNPVWLIGFSLGAACGFAEYLQRIERERKPATSCCSRHKTEHPVQVSTTTSCRSRHKAEHPVQVSTTTSCCSRHKTEHPVQVSTTTSCRSAAGGPPCPHAACGLAEYLQNIKKKPETDVPRPFRGYAGIILFSPAIRLRPWAHAVRLLFPWPRIRLSSLAGVRYQVHDHTSIAAYRALFALRRLIRTELSRVRRGLETCPLPPLTIIYDARDILTAGRALGRWLPGETVPAFHRVRAKNTWHHLITDRRALGDEAWQKLTRLIREMLDSG